MNNINKLLGGKIPTNISIDEIAHAVYFKVSEEEVLKTVKINNSVNVDYGKNNEVIGIEIIRVSKIELLLKRVLKDISNTLPAKVLQPAN